VRVSGALLAAALAIAPLSPAALLQVFSSAR